MIGRLTVIRHEVNPHLSGRIAEILPLKDDQRARRGIRREEKAQGEHRRDPRTSGHLQPGTGRAWAALAAVSRHRVSTDRRVTVRKCAGELYGRPMKRRQHQLFVAVAEIEEKARALAGSVDRDRLDGAGVDGRRVGSDAGNRAVGPRGQGLCGGADDYKKSKGWFAHFHTSRRWCCFAPRVFNLSQKLCLTI